MKKSKSNIVYECAECGQEFKQWFGWCKNCQARNSLVEKETFEESRSNSSTNKSNSVEERALPVSQIQVQNHLRTKLFSAELNRMLGDGLVKGSIVLLSGDAGIGKSTLLTQIAGHAANQLKVLYASAEESIQQVKTRIERMGITSDNFYLLYDTCVENIINEALRIKADIVCFDSLQTLYSKDIEFGAGSIAQARYCIALIQKFAKDREISVFVITHITKDNQIAGPKVVEHAVDVTLFFEGDTTGQYRILRSLKNRFAPSPDIAVFEMTEAGLFDVDNLANVFISERHIQSAGTSIGITMEGTRSILFETQALVETNEYSMPVRQSIGYDRYRLNLLLGIISKHLKIPLYSRNVTVNLVGGLQVSARETSIDLAVFTSILSSLWDIPMNKNWVFMGEVDLTGAVRAVSHQNIRLKEIQKGEFDTVFANIDQSYQGLDIRHIRHIRQIAEWLQSFK